MTASADDDTTDDKTGSEVLLDINRTVHSLKHKKTGALNYTSCV